MLYLASVSSKSGYSSSSNGPRFWVDIPPLRCTDSFLSTGLEDVLCCPLLSPDDG